MAYTTAMFKDCVLVSVKCPCPGNSRKFENGDGAENKDWLKHQKQLLASPEYESIRAIQAATRQWFRTRAVPGEFFREGCYLLNKDFVQSAKEYVDNQRVALQGAVDGLLDVYDVRKTEAKDRFDAIAAEKGEPSLYDEADYPTPAQWQSAVRIKVQYTEFGTPESLEAIDPELYAEQRAEADAEWKKAIEDVRLALRGSLAEIIGKLVGRLEPDAQTGTAKSIKTNTFNKLAEFISFFEKRDVTNDQQCKALVDKARQVLADVDCEKIRTNAEFSASVQQSFSKLHAEVVEATEAQASRAIEFDEIAA